METTKSKNPWIAVLLGLLVPAMGLLYVGHKKKALSLYLSILSLLILGRFISHSFWIFVVLLIVLLTLVVYALIDGILIAKKGKELALPALDKWYIYLIIIVIHYGALETYKQLAAGQLFPVEYVTLPSSIMEPSMIQNDHFAFFKTQEIERSNIAIFHWPHDQQTMYVQRCVAVAGDKLELRNGIVHIAGQSRENPNKLKFAYQVTATTGRLGPREFESMGIRDSYPMQEGGHMVHLSMDQLKTLQQSGKASEIKRWNWPGGNREFYPGSKSSEWTFNDYGPLYIPKRGERIELTTENIAFYGQYITVEDPSIQLLNGRLYADDLPLTEYTFKQNYYFMMGDNRDNSYDSRSVGLVPEDLLIGKASYLIYAEDWTRIGLNLRD